MNILHFVVRQTLVSRIHTEGQSLIVTYDASKDEVQISTLLGVRVDSFGCNALVALLLSADQSVLLMLTLEGDLLALDLNEKGRTQTTTYNKSYSLHKTGGTTLALSNDKLLLAVGFGKQIQLFQIRSGKPVRPLQMFEFDAAVQAICFTDDGLGIRVVTQSSVVILQNNDD